MTEEFITSLGMTEGDGNRFTSLRITNDWCLDELKEETLGFSPGGSHLFHKKITPLKRGDFLVRRGGFEPSTKWLRATCSTGLS
ncbi:MAG: hypothetical protein UT94_C0018G0007 [Candidatus Uhrbacteria bacterium GW2011_GWF2_40_263]|nr:MAG: hypothetical protein UT94_C0018G0007 [Candidatus Uhrbacteria bacterium GW2011_GWF2_40_263]